MKIGEFGKDWELSEYPDTVRLYSGYSPYFPDNAEIDEKAGD